MGVMVELWSCAYDGWLEIVWC